MEPKFQSSFIPKGPTSPSANMPSMGSRPVQRDFLSILGNLFFAISVLMAVGVFGYKFYLINVVKSSSTAIEEAKERLQPEVVAQITGLNDRIVSTKTIIDNHVILTPVFDFLEASTPKTSVSFSNMNYTSNEAGVVLTLEGKARDYTSLAFLSDTMAKNPYIKNPVFSDIALDDKGNVSFKFTSNVDKPMISYRKMIEKLGSAASFSTSTSSTTGTSSQASSTPR